MYSTVLKFLALISLAALVQGHGYLLKPPARGTAWRAGFNTPQDSNDMGMYCGGRGTQHNKNGGKCGVCGENYSNPNKRLEPGPSNKYATGTIVAEYEQGQTIDVTVHITAFHKGYYEFRLCENDVPQKGKDASIAVQQDCFDRHLLKSPSGSTRFTATDKSSTHKVVLDADVYCKACVLQWRYRTANNWGCENGKCDSGMGPQEEFWGCSDIAINEWGTVTMGIDKMARPTVETTTATKTDPVTIKTEKPTIKTEKPTIKTENTTIKTENTTADITTAMNGQSTNSPIMETKTYEITSKSKPATQPPKTAIPMTQAPTTQAPTTPAPTTQAPTTPAPTTQAPTTPAPTTQAPTRAPSTMRPRPVTRKVAPPKKRGRKVCSGKGIYRGYNYTIYCNNNCNHNPPHCPRSICACRYV